MRRGRFWQGRVPMGARLAIVVLAAGLALVPTWGQALDRGSAERDLITLTNSDRTSLAIWCASGKSCGLKTTCVQPARSRRSTKIRPPWSRCR